jgi:hypothetical protein
MKMTNGFVHRLTVGALLAVGLLTLLGMMGAFATEFAPF